VHAAHPSKGLGNVVLDDEVLHHVLQMPNQLNSFS
jgi:hypothetical protein